MRDLRCDDCGKPSTQLMKNGSDLVCGECAGVEPRAVAPIAGQKDLGPFAKVLAEMQSLHDKKGADYGATGDPFKNVKSSEEFGIPPWLGSILRANDKVSRIKSFAQKGRLENESLRDSLIDLANYAAIAVALYDEANSTT